MRIVQPRIDNVVLRIVATSVLILLLGLLVLGLYNANLKPFYYFAIVLNLATKKPSQN